MGAIFGCDYKQYLAMFGRAWDYNQPCPDWFTVVLGEKKVIPPGLPANTIMI